MMPIHIRAESGDIAPIVLLPGDPGRAKRVAERLEDAQCYNDFRGLTGYTGVYKGHSISVQTTGMGAPSAAIVVEELAMLGAKTVIRIGTCGGASAEVRPGDLVIGTAACPLDGTTRQYLAGDSYAPAASYRVVRALVDAADGAHVRYHTGLIATEDALYAVTPGWAETWSARGVLAQEMEASAVFTVAALRGLEAGCILTAANSAGQHERLPDDELLPAIDRMIDVALEAAVALGA
ncbi:MAG: purine-nucleoside phosphorylase [Chloroflexi bacterium]|nr:purine-nucleoside phosphorylase [Chloroflexota bacterium]